MKFLYLTLVSAFVIRVPRFQDNVSEANYWDGVQPSEANYWDDVQAYDDDEMDRSPMYLGARKKLKDQKLSEQTSSFHKREFTDLFKKKHTGDCSRPPTNANDPPVNTVLLEPNNISWKQTWKQGNKVSLSGNAKVLQCKLTSNGYKPWKQGYETVTVSGEIEGKTLYINHYGSY